MIGSRARFGLALTLFGLACAGTVTPAQACPNCKEAVAEDGNSNAQQLANGYSTSILLMMGMPLALAAVGTHFVVKAAKDGRLPEL